MFAIVTLQSRNFKVFAADTYAFQAKPASIAAGAPLPTVSLVLAPFSVMVEVDSEQVLLETMSCPIDAVAE